MVATACDEDENPSPAARGGGGAGGAPTIGGGAGGPAGGEGGGPEYPCLHDVCFLGSQLEASCDPCVAAVCAVNSYCCEVRWDDACIASVAAMPEVCGCAPEPDCQDLYDDDLDGAVDCLDPDCVERGGCDAGDEPLGGPCLVNGDCATASGAPVCVDEISFQWPGGFCSELCAPGEPCGDTGDGYCVDLGLGGPGLCYRTCEPKLPDACRPGYSCRLEAAPVPACVPIPEDCSTPGDEDADGDADCRDHDCIGAFDCFEICDDGLDDNDNDTIDCDDPTCLGVSVCAEELAPICEALPPAPSRGCVEIGGQYQCDPVTGEGCLPWQTCSLVGGGFICFGPPNDAPLCGDCGSLHGRCAPGMDCSLMDAVCQRYCCHDDDCGPGGHCNTAALILTIGRPDAPPVGVCVQGPEAG